MPLPPDGEAREELMTASEAGDHPPPAPPIEGGENAFITGIMVTTVLIKFTIG